MTLPFRPDPPRKPSRLEQALTQILMAQLPDATRVQSQIPQHLSRPRGVMRETPQGPSALPLPNATPASQERGVDTGSRAIMGLVDASDAVLEGGQSIKAAREGRFRNAIAHALLAAAPVASSTSVRAVGEKLGGALRSVLPIERLSAVPDSPLDLPAFGKPLTVARGIRPDGVNIEVQAKRMTVPGTPMQRVFNVVATGPDGSRVGLAEFDGEGRSFAVRVDEAHRRKGIATDMYDAIGQLLGRPVVPATTSQTTDGAAFWASRARK